MCISCGCWMDPTSEMGGDGNHQEDSYVCPILKLLRRITLTNGGSNGCTSEEEEE